MALLSGKTRCIHIGQFTTILRGAKQSVPLRTSEGQSATTLSRSKMTPLSSLYHVFCAARNTRSTRSTGPGTGPFRVQSPKRTVSASRLPVNGARGVWHLVQRSPHKCACPHVRHQMFVSRVQAPSGSSPRGTPANSRSGAPS